MVIGRRSSAKIQFLRDNGWKNHCQDCSLKNTPGHALSSFIDQLQESFQSPGFPNSYRSRNRPA